MTKLLGIFLLISTISCPLIDAVAVMSVDLGSEWMKVAIVSPGVPMEIALNRESQRKTAVVVALRDGERCFSDLAVSLGIRFPEKIYGYLLDLLGKNISNPIVELYRQRFPFYKITGDPERGTIIFHHPEGPTFTPEELLAMVLKSAQQIASNAAGQPINDAVITVPPFFNQPERRSLIHAAQLAGLKVLQIMNSNTAVALHYGIFRRKDFNDTPVNILFYDMGASSTEATIATYQMVKSKERGFTETNPQVTIRGVGYDRQLGGLEMQLRLRDHLGRAFNEQKKTKNDVFKSPRALAKLFSEAGRLKKVLSANTEHVAQVENVLDDQDLKVPYSRPEFEELCNDLLNRVADPVHVALKMARMTMDDISQIILAGAGTRVPGVQQKLLEATDKSELGKSINTDEAAALGAVYQAAYLSKGFKVKTFLIKDANIFPIQVDFQRSYETDGQKGIKVVRRTLFGRGNPIPQKKVITFTRHINDFDFDVNYGDLDFLSEGELKSFGSLNISHIKISGVEAALAKHFEDGSETKGVKAKFHMDESGILTLDQVESVFEKRVEETKAAEDEAPLGDLESTLAKLGSTIGKLFSSSSEETTSEPPEPTPSPMPEEEVPLEKPDEIKETDNKKEKDSKDDLKESKESDEKTVKVNKTEKGGTTNDSQADLSGAPADKNIKVVFIKEILSLEVTRSDLPDPTSEQKTASREKLKGLDDQDQARLERDKAHNALESFVLETKDKLHTKEYELASTEEERNNYMKHLKEVGEWLEYESDASATEVFKEKLSTLKFLTRDLFERVREHRERPEAIKALRDMLNISTLFLNGAKNVSEDDQVFSEVELNTLESLIKETLDWADDLGKQQKGMTLQDMPKLTVKAIAEKISNLDREVKYLLNKARFTPPKKTPPPKPVEPKSNESETDSKTEDAGKVKDDGEKKVESETKEEPLQLDAGVKEETSTHEDSSEPVPDASQKETPHSEL